MRKIISLYQRNYETDRLVRDEVVPGAEWVLRGEGVATQKLDGTAVLIDGGHPFMRYDAKPGRQKPHDFVAAQPEPDPVTGHWPGWVPARAENPAHRWFWEAFRERENWPDWTYELVGPKVQGNAEHYERHQLIAHGSITLPAVALTFEGVREFLARHDIEGIVWWHDPNDLDCDKVKIKCKDFGFGRLIPMEMRQPMRSA